MSVIVNTEIHYASQADWHSEGVRRFGADEMQWRFVCPACGYVASTKQWADLNGTTMVAFSCIGRLMPTCRQAFGGDGPGPCNYAGGGLFRIAPVIIEDCEGRYFAFAS